MMMTEQAWIESLTDEQYDFYCWLNAVVTAGPDFESEGE